MFARLVDSIVMPPTSLLLLMLAGLWLMRYRRKAGHLTFAGGLLLLVALMLPPLPAALMAMLETSPALSRSDLKHTTAQAIVILGGGRYPGAPEYDNQDTVSSYTLQRLRYGAYLHRLTGLPILVSGGKVFGDAVSEARLMANTLRNEFQVPVKWIEGESVNTWQNAKFSNRLLQQEAIRHTLLVTHAFHMPRSLYAFEQQTQDMRVTPAPTAFHASNPNTPFLIKIMPSAHNLLQSRVALHEIIGYLWYWMKS